jgi:hypothetical protein
VGNVCYHLVHRLFFVPSTMKGSRYQNNYFFRMRVLNLVAQIKGLTQDEGNQDQVAE